MAGLQICCEGGTARSVDRLDVGCYGLNCVPQNSYVEVLMPGTQNVTVFGERVFRELKASEVLPLGWTLSQYDWCPDKKRRLGPRHAQRVGG